MPRGKRPLWLRKLRTATVAAPSLVRVRLAARRPVEPDAALRLALIADLHTDADPYRDRSNVLRRAFAGMMALCRGYDGVVAAGDLTNSAHPREYALLLGLLRAYFPGALERMIPQMGNHDARGTSIDPDFPQACRLFQDFCGQCGLQARRNYFAVRKKAHTFLVLGTERLLQNEAYLSDAQFEWLEKELARACAGGKPVFVVCHQPPHGRNQVDQRWPEGALGAESQRLDALLLCYGQKARAPIIYISGHLHKRSPAAFEQAGQNVYYLNLPGLLDCGCAPRGTMRAGGEGFVLAAENGKVTLQGINFITGKRHPEQRYEILYGAPGDEAMPK